MSGIGASANLLIVNLGASVQRSQGLELVLVKEERIATRKGQEKVFDFRRRMNS